MLRPYLLGDFDYDLDQKFNNLLNNRVVNYLMPQLGTRMSNNILVDVVETKNNISVKAHVPGIEKENIHVRVNSNNILDISVEQSSKREEKNDNETTYHYYESSYTALNRSIKLPKNTDTSNHNATLKNGVLEIVFGKKSLPEGVKDIKIA